MIIDNERDVTAAVLAAMQRTEDPRLREILVSLVKHLHGFIRDVNLSESEFREATRLLVAMGQQTDDSHNEVVLMAGSLGVSALVCLLNNTSPQRPHTSQNTLGPFWRLHAPETENGASIVRSETHGAPLMVDLTILDEHDKPVAEAEVDIWHAAPDGMYENQDADQADMNLRGKFTTDQAGRVWFRSVRPSGYPVPVDGVVGQLQRAQQRHPFRPAHVHALVYKPGFKTLITQIYDNEDPHLASDTQFGVTRTLCTDYVRHDEQHPDFPDLSPAWYSLSHVLRLQPGEAHLPQAPIK